MVKFPYFNASVKVGKYLADSPILSFQGGNLNPKPLKNDG